MNFASHSSSTIFSIFTDRTKVKKRLDIHVIRSKDNLEDVSLALRIDELRVPLILNNFFHLYRSDWFCYVSRYLPLVMSKVIDDEFENVGRDLFDLNLFGPAVALDDALHEIAHHGGISVNFELCTVHVIGRYEGESVVQTSVKSEFFSHCVTF